MRRPAQCSTDRTSFASPTYGDGTYCTAFCVRLASYVGLVQDLAVHVPFDGTGSLWRNQQDFVGEESISVWDGLRTILGRMGLWKMFPPNMGRCRHKFGGHSAIARNCGMLESAGVLSCLRLKPSTRFSLKDRLFPTLIPNLDDPDYASSLLTTSLRRPYPFKPGDMWILINRLQVHIPNCSIELVILHRLPHLVQQDDSDNPSFHTRHTVPGDGHFGHREIEAAAAARGWAVCHEVCDGASRYPVEEPDGDKNRRR